MHLCLCPPVRGVFINWVVVAALTFWTVIACIMAVVFCAVFWSKLRRRDAETKEKDAAANCDKGKHTPNIEEDYILSYLVAPPTKKGSVPQVQYQNHPACLNG